MLPFTPPTHVRSLNPSNVEFFKNLILWVPSHPVVGWQGLGRSQKSIAIPVVVARKQSLPAWGLAVNSEGSWMLVWGIFETVPLFKNIILMLFLTKIFTWYGSNKPWALAHHQWLIAHNHSSSRAMRLVPPRLASKLAAMRSLYKSTQVAVSNHIFLDLFG
jgi:hypothetical protein